MNQTNGGYLTSLTDIRHILQELTVPSYVPNDTFLVGGGLSGTSDPASSMEDNPNMLILTGPNYSGKSAYIKQVSNRIPRLIEGNRLISN